MRKKTQDVLTTQKRQKTCLAAQTVGSSGCHTGSALLADNMVNRPHNLPRNLTIGVDLMGSDNTPHVLLNALKELSLPAGVELHLICTPELEAAVSPYFKVSLAPEVIEMGENPLTALRRKKNASTYVGMRLLKEGKIDAFVSAGNTGALVSCAKMVLSTLPGILRPSLVALMPTKKDPVAVLDVGANVQVKTAHLIQFALIGVAYQQARGIANPTVGILNIGSEAVKGTTELRQAYHALQRSPFFQFSGNIEGKSVFEGDVNVLVTDGFTGNIFLKTAEGIANLILDRLHTNIPTPELKKFAPLLNDLQRHLHYGEYPGALLAGVRGLVIKCHGYSTPQAFANGVLGAIDLASEKFIQLLQTKLEQFKNFQKLS